MRNFKIKVYFKKDILIQPEIVLVRNDYNSTEFEFEFDVEEGKKVFELKKPDGTVWIKDIVDNKIVLVDCDDKGNIIPIINQSREYDFEIVCYDENSKITASQKGKFSARDEVVDLDEDKLSENVKIPLLDSLINETIEASNNSKEQAGYAKEQGDYAKGQGNYAKDVASNIESKVTNGDFNGATFTPSIDKEGNISWTNDKGLDNPASSNIMGPQGPQGIQGEAFTIKKTYSSKEEMNNDFDNMQIGDYVMITSNVELEDNAKMYSRGQDEWIFITDFSGATGIQGPQGIQGIQGIQGPKGDKGDKPIKGVDYFTETDKNEIVSSITDDANSEFNINVNEKLAEYNQNHEEKVQEYNQNAETKVNEFNEEVESLRDELNDCYNNQLIGQASGTSIYVDDSADARMRVLEIDGALKQETTKGISLIDFANPDHLSPNETIRYEFSNDILTVSSLKDGSYGYAKWNITSLLKNNTGKTLYFYAKNSTTEVGRLPLIQLIIQYNDTTPTVYKDLFRPGIFGSYVIPNNIEKIKEASFNVYPNDGSNLVSNSCTIVKPMLYFGTTTDDVEYEPYTGGQASPNPDYPQEIEVLKAINLLPYPYQESTKTVNGITFTDNGDGTITLSGTATSNASYNLFGHPVNNQKPILGKYISGGINTDIRVRAINRSDNGYTVLANSIGNQQEIDLTTYQDGYIEIFVREGTVCNNVVIKPMLTKTNKINSYIPYNCIQNEIVGANLYNYKDIYKEDNRYSIEEDGWITFSHTNNIGITQYIAFLTNVSNRLKENTSYNVFLECKSVSGYTNNSIHVTSVHTDNSGQFKDEFAITTGNLNANTIINKKITTIDNFENANNMLRTFIVIYPGETCSITFRISVLEDTTITLENFKYIPYQEETVDINLQGNFIAKLTDEIKDTLRIENGHAILTKKVGKKIFDGSEHYDVYNNDSIGKTRGFLTKIGSLAISYNKQSCFCENFSFGETWNTDNECFNNQGSSFILRINLERLSQNNSSGMKQYVAEHNILIYYPLAEPYDIDLGPVKLPKTFKGTTNIFLNANLETNMHVDYVKDTQLTIDNLQSQIDNITALLSTTETSALLLDNLQSDFESEVI